MAVFIAVELNGCDRDFMVYKAKISSLWLFTDSFSIPVLCHSLDGGNMEQASGTQLLYTSIPGVGPPRVPGGMAVIKSREAGRKR